MFHFMNLLRTSPVKVFITIPISEVWGFKKRRQRVNRVFRLVLDSLVYWTKNTHVLQQAFSLFKTRDFLRKAYLFWPHYSFAFVLIPLKNAGKAGSDRKDCGILGAVVLFTSIYALPHWKETTKMAASSSQWAIREKNLKDKANTII